PSGWRVGGFGGVAFGTALQPMTGGAHALQLVFGVGVGLGFDVVAVGAGPYSAELADRVAGEHLAPDVRPVRRQPALAVAALPASAHGRLLFVGAAFGVAADGPSAEAGALVVRRVGDDCVEP